MYLSRLLLTGEQLRNPYEIHRSLWTVFPEAPDQSRDFLFRVEKRSPSQAQVILQSLREPTHETDSVQLLASKAFDVNLIENSQLRFLLIANPIKSIADDQGRLDSKGELKRCRVPLINQEDQIEWIKRKFDRAALIRFVEIEKQLPLHFHKGSKPGKIQPYAFKGILEVTCPESMKELLRTGIGPAKAFGCGLLSISRT